jgi:hypothetical protein
VGPGEAVVNLRAVNLPMLVGGLGAHLRVPLLPAGSIGQGKDGGTRADFFPPAASGVSTTRSCASDLGLRQKPDALG